MSFVCRALAAAALVATLGGCRADVERDAPGDPEAETEAETLLSAGDSVAPWHPSVRRARVTDIGFDVTRGEHSPDGPRSPQRLRLDLFDDVTVEAELTDMRRGRFGFVWVGRVEGDPHGEVVLAPSENGHLAGTIRADGMLFQLMTRAGRQLVVERDERRIPDEVAPRIAERPAGPMAVAPVSSANDDGDQDVVVDVLVVYTDDARVGAGDVAALEASIDLAIEETNHGYASSGVAIDLRLVGTAELAYDESELDFVETLEQLRRADDGVLDEVHALRDELGADHVVLLVDEVTSAAGIGYVMTSGDGPWFAEWAFSVVAREYATGAYTFAHELGHNMGSEHDHDHAGEGYFPYSHGLRQPEAGFRSIMAYGCDDGWCARINRWSNPLVEIEGTPTGVADHADNARSLNATAEIVAAFREPDAPPPDAPEAAELVEPTPGTMLPSSQVTFSWTEVEASQHELWLGTAPGDASYFHGSGLLGTSTVVGNLPTGGGTVYARLWSFGVDHVWRYNDYEYTSHFEGEASLIVYPSDGSTLWSTTIPFVWESGSASIHRLQLGTEQEPGQYYDGDVTTKKWALVGGLPSDGSAVLATLWSLTPSGWVATNAHYTAYTAPSFAAHIAFPADGATLLPGSVTFRFTYTPASQHWLVLHSPGNLLFSGSTGSNDGVVVHGLPEDGRDIQATLWSLGATGWATTGASFTAASH